MYNPKERKQRYLKNQERDKNKALEYYRQKKDAINAERRKKYKKNITIEREKVRIRVQKSRKKNRVSK